MFKVDGFNYYFDWDTNKALSNFKKHGVSFLEAASTFSDVNAVILVDEERLEQEERFIIIGFSDKTRLLYVCHCYRENNIVRIISARKPTKTEEMKYRNEV